MSLCSSLHCLKRIDLYSMLIKHRQLKEINLHLEYSQIFQSLLKSVRLKNLSTMDSGGIVLEWFRNYLTNRKQIVNYRSVKSKSSILLVGFPKGLS